MIRIRVLALALICTAAAQGRGVKARFHPQLPETGPFPNDFLTVPDPAQRTQRRVNLPLPDCASLASTCEERKLLNELDGFSLRPRGVAAFSAPIQPDTLRDGVFFVWLDRLRPEAFGLFPPGTLMAINQPVYDPFTNTAYFWPDDRFEQQRRYLLVVTSGVKDLSGDPVEREEGYDYCLDGRNQADYCMQLARDVSFASRFLPPGRAIVSAASFTTLSATAYLEQARRTLETEFPSFERDRANAVVPLAQISEVTWRVEAEPGGPLQAQTLPVPVSLLSQQPGIGRFAFGSFRAPRWLNDQQFIASQPSAQSVSRPASSETIAFQAILPSSPPPPGGYPVLLAAHAIGGSRFDIPFALAPVFVSAGFAVIGFNAYGHGFGPGSLLRITTKDGRTIDIPAPGRAVDLNGDRRYGSDGAGWEGCLLLAGDSPPVGMRDCFRQTALDYMQFVRAVSAGIDFDGDGIGDLNPQRISLYGLSLGAFYGSLAVAVEPGIAQAVLAGGGGTLIETARLSPVFRGLLGSYLGARRPPLAERSFAFDDQMPLRFEPVRILTAPRAAAIQETESNLEWLEMPGAPLAFAPHFRSATLPDVPIKRVLFQIPAGDQTVPNPAESSLIRAANMVEFTSLYRADLARAVVPSLPANPHTFLVSAGSLVELAISLEGQRQALRFLSQDSDAVPDANLQLRPIFGQDVFEIPTRLPERLQFQPVNTER